MKKTCCLLASGGFMNIDLAAAQNVRSGSSPVPTHDPDLRSRPFERI